MTCTLPIITDQDLYTGSTDTRTFKPGDFILYKPYASFGEYKGVFIENAPSRPAIQSGTVQRYKIKYKSSLGEIPEIVDWFEICQVTAAPSVEAPTVPSLIGMGRKRRKTRKSRKGKSRRRRHA